MSIDTERRGGELIPLEVRTINGIEVGIVSQTAHIQGAQSIGEVASQSTESGEEQRRRELWDQCTKNPSLFVAKVEQLCDTVATPLMRQQLAAASKLEEIRQRALKGNSVRKAKLTQTTAEKIVKNDDDTKERVDAYLAQLSQQFQDKVEARLGVEKSDLQAARETSEQTAKLISNVKTVVSNTQVNLGGMRDNTALDNAHHAIDSFAVSQIEKARQLAASYRQTNATLSTLPEKFAEVEVTSKELAVASDDQALPELYNNVNSPSDQRMMRARGLAIGVYSWRNTGIIDDSGKPSEQAIRNRVRVESLRSDLKALGELTKEYERDQVALQRSPGHRSIFDDPNKADEYASALIAVLSARTQELDQLAERNTAQSRRVYMTIEERFEADIKRLQQSYKEEVDAYCLKQSTAAREYTRKTVDVYDKEYKQLEDEAAAIKGRGDTEAARMQQCLGETEKRITTLDKAKYYFQKTSDHLFEVTKMIPRLETEIDDKQITFGTVSNAFGVLMQSTPDNVNTQRAIGLAVEEFQKSRPNDAAALVKIDGVEASSITSLAYSNNLNEQLQILQAMVGITQDELSKKMQNYNVALSGLNTAASDRRHAFNDFLESDSSLRGTEVVQLPLEEQADIDRFTRQCVLTYEEQRRNKVRGTKATDVMPERGIPAETWLSGLRKAIEKAKLNRRKTKHDY